MDTPIFVNTDPAQILAQILDSYELMTGLQCFPGTPEYSHCSAIAYQKSLTLQRVNETGLAMLADFAKGVVLDYLASPFNIKRLPAQPAICTLHFEIVPGHLQVVLPLGTRVASLDGTSIFQTIDDVTINVGVNSIEIDAECQVNGLIGNGQLTLQVTQLLDPLAYVLSVWNTNTTAGGSDAETDAELLERIKLSTSKYSVAGSRDAYIFWAKSVNPLIVDIDIATLEDYLPITSPTEWTTGQEWNVNDFATKDGIIFVCTKHIVSSTIEPILDLDHFIHPGVINIYALMLNGELPTTAINNNIAAVLNSKEIRPLSDIVNVQTPTRQNYSIAVDTWIYPTANASLIESLQYQAVLDYGVQNSQKLGIDIVCSKIEKLCLVDGVEDVTVTIVPDGESLTGRNLVISPAQVGILTGVTVTIVDTNNG